MRKLRKFRREDVAGLKRESWDDVAEEPKRKLTLHDRVKTFSRLTFQQADAKKVVVRNLKGLVHKVVRIRRKNLLIDAVHTSTPLGMMQPGSVSRRRVGDTEWAFGDFEYNHCNLGEHFSPLVGMVVGYEVEEREDGGSVYLIVAAPNDRFEYKFNLGNSEIEVLDGFPTD